ncbi:helix-turn-helix transcriptional regulator [Streptomyces sp. NPDC047017]|uniref:helix-turn-helix transcriptional regulator n=1 Tax=Streptomyces sp. NPDC047017 TaxID=3155024 RepID=UPI003406D52F
MRPAPHPEHGPEDLCPAGAVLYERALRHGRIAAGETGPAPCLAAHGLLRPAAGDDGVLEPVGPATALHRLLRACENRIAGERRRGERLAETFEPLLRLAVPPEAAGDIAVARLLEGTERINRAITEAMERATGELLTIQPPMRRCGRERAERGEAIALVRDQGLLDRGGRIRTLYQHTQRHLPLAQSRYEQLRGDVRVRTLDEVPDRLLVIDRAVAFTPADADGARALEIRHPALISYLVTVFERLWRLGTPMHPRATEQPSPDGITPRQRTIAGLLVEGHTDAVIAERLGLNVRTAREHIAKLAAALGSTSRAQLGYLIGRSGILGQGH